MVFVVQIHFPQVGNRPQVLAGIAVHRFAVAVDNVLGLLQD